MRPLSDLDESAVVGGSSLGLLPQAPVSSDPLSKPWFQERSSWKGRWGFLIGIKANCFCRNSFGVRFSNGFWGAVRLTVHYMRVQTGHHRSFYFRSGGVGDPVRILGEANRNLVNCSFTKLAWKRNFAKLEMQVQEVGQVGLDKRIQLTTGT